MSFLENESLIFVIYLKFWIQRYITCQGFFVSKRLNSRMKVQKYPIFIEKNDVTLNITKVKNTVIFKIMPFMVQTKTQIASNTYRYKKILKKILTQKSNHTYKLIYQKMSHVTFVIEKWSYKENRAPNTQKQLWRSPLSILYHQSSYISVSSQN